MTLTFFRGRVSYCIWLRWVPWSTHNAILIFLPFLMFSFEHAAVSLTPFDFGGDENIASGCF